MKHARPEDLSGIEPLLTQIRSVNNLKEKQPGHFYFKGTNIVHFHTDNSRIFIDIGGSRTGLSPSINPTEIDDIMRKVREYMHTI